MPTPENHRSSHEPAPDQPERTRDRRGPSRLAPLALLLLVGVVYVLVARPFGPTRADGASLPPVFAQGVSLRDAVDAARDEDRFVIAVASAAWCGPCGRYKGAALRDARLEDWVRDRAVAVYVDIDAAKDDAALIGARIVPTTAIFYRGERLGSVEGVLPPDRLIAWLDERWSGRGALE